MSKLTFRNIISTILEQASEPMSTEEIWNKALELNEIQDFGSIGKTPWATMGAIIYTDIKENRDLSKYVQVSKRPAKFCLRSNYSDKASIVKNKVQILNQTKEFKEKDLHILLSSFIYSSSNFNAYTQTISHELSKRAEQGKNKWIHPDIVGVSFPFSSYKSEVLNLQSSLKVNSIKLYSFELKIDLDFSNLRQYYFQAVSNSNWANEGYLVVLNLKDDKIELMEEIKRLNNAFGIGLIKLNLDNIFDSEIIFPARTKENIDWDTVNLMADINKGFKLFIDNIIEDCALGKIKSNYDQVFNPDDILLEKYLIDKKLKI